MIAINSGANMNFDRLRHVAERADVGARREALLAVEIPEKPGSFLEFCEALGQHSITEFNYRYQGSVRARVFVGFGLSRGAEEVAEVVGGLTAAGYGVADVSDNEMAKLHVRYMIGGRAPPELAAASAAGAAGEERLYRFEFPERPGALLRFLKAVGTRWNITLFHYRNHGSDYGRVLAGIQVPKIQMEDFLLHLQELHYPYTDESDNAAYRLFLGA